MTARAYSARVCRSKGLHGRKLALCFYSTCAEKNQWLYLLLQRRLRIFQFQDCHRWGKQSWILVRQVDRFVVTLSKQRDLSELQENLVKHTTKKKVETVWQGRGNQRNFLWKRKWIRFENEKRDSQWTYLFSYFTSPKIVKFWLWGNIFLSRTLDESRIDWSQSTVMWNTDFSYLPFLIFNFNIWNSKSLFHLDFFFCLCCLLF